MLGKLFPGMFGGGGSTGITSTRLKVGDATLIDGDLPNQITQRYVLPAEVSASQVLEEARVAGNVKALAYLHTKFSRHRLKQLQEYAKIYTNQLKYSQEAMRVEEQLQSEKAMHGEAVIRHAFGSQEKHVQLSGYEQAFESVGSSFEF